MRVCDICKSSDAVAISIPRVMPRGSGGRIEIVMDYWMTDLCSSCALKLAAKLNELRAELGKFLRWPMWKIQGLARDPGEKRA